MRRGANGLLFKKREDLRWGVNRSSPDTEQPGKSADFVDLPAAAATARSGPWHRGAIRKADDASDGGGHTGAEAVAGKIRPARAYRKLLPPARRGATIWLALRPESISAVVNHSFRVKSAGS